MAQNIKSLAEFISVVCVRAQVFEAEYLKYGKR